MSSVIILLECDHESSRIISVHEGSKENKKRIGNLARQRTKEAESKKAAARAEGRPIPASAMLWYETEVHQVNS